MVKTNESSVFFNKDTYQHVVRSNMSSYVFLDKSCTIRVVHVLSIISYAFVRFVLKYVLLGAEQGNISVIIIS